MWETAARLAVVLGLTALVGCSSGSGPAPGTPLATTTYVAAPPVSLPTVSKPAPPARLQPFLHNACGILSAAQLGQLGLRADPQQGRSEICLYTARGSGRSVTVDVANVSIPAAATMLQIGGHPAGRSVKHNPMENVCTVDVQLGPDPIYQVHGGSRGGQRGRGSSSRRRAC